MPVIVISVALILGTTAVVVARQLSNKEVTVHLGVGGNAMGLLPEKDGQLSAMRMASNESAAISTLRSLGSAQAQIQSSGIIDTDGDGAGEYGYLAELAGATPIRVASIEGAPTAGTPGRDELSPAVLSAAFGELEGSVVERSGYLYQVWLPSAANIGVPEAPQGGRLTPPYPDSDASEIFWSAYAWPKNAGETGARAFFMNQEGDLLQYSNHDGLYSGHGASPPPDAALSSDSPNDMSAATPEWAKTKGNDGREWTSVR